MMKGNLRYLSAKPKERALKSKHLLTTGYPSDAQGEAIKAVAPGKLAAMKKTACHGSLRYQLTPISAFAEAAAVAVLRSAGGSLTGESAAALCVVGC